MAIRKQPKAVETLKKRPVYMEPELSLFKYVCEVIESNYHFLFFKQTLLPNLLTTHKNR